MLTVFQLEAFYHKLNYKKRDPKVSFVIMQFLANSTDSWSSESNRSVLSRCKVKREVVSIALMHYLHP
jgi:hypothetical protein